MILFNILTVKLYIILYFGFDVEMESFILGKLPFVVNNDEISLHVISSEIYVLRITDDRHVSLYSFSVKNSNSQSFQLIWENTAVVRDW